MNEFIMYWLPKLQDNGESIVNFSFTEELQASNAIIVDNGTVIITRIKVFLTADKNFSSLSTKP